MSAAFSRWRAPSTRSPRRDGRILRADVERIFHRVSRRTACSATTRSARSTSDAMLGADAKAKADGAHRVLGAVGFRRLVFLRRQDFGMAEGTSAARPSQRRRGEHFALLAWACSARRDRAPSARSRNDGARLRSPMRTLFPLPRAGAGRRRRSGARAYRTAFANNPNFMDAARDSRDRMRREKRGPKRRRAL